jgi:cobalt-zinc-cadmium efflux system membrane fusion protein
MRSALLLACGVASCALGASLATGCKPHGAEPEASAAAATGNPGDVTLEAAKMTAAGIVVQPVDEQPVEDTIVTSGTVTFDDLKVAHIYSPVNGKVTQIFAQLGARVKSGEKLAAIQSPDIGQAVSDVHKADADYVAAKHDYERQIDLYKKHAAAQKDVEQAEDRMRQAKAELERAQAKANLLRAGSVDTVTQTYTLASPIDGEVLMRAVNPGVEVAGQYSSGSAVELFTVGEIDHVWAMGDVYEVDIPRVKKDSPVSLKVVAFKDKVFRGKVEWIQHVLDPVTRTAKVRFSFDNPNNELLPQMYGTVYIKVDQRKALAIPRSAILRLGDTRVVFVQTGTEPDGKVKFERRPVDVDEFTADNWLPIRHGLEKGALVVTKGAVLLSEM